MWSDMNTKIVDKSKNVLKNTLSIAESDHRGIATSFFSKKQEHGREIGFGLNS